MLCQAAEDEHILKLSEGVEIFTGEHAIRMGIPL